MHIKTIEQKLTDGSRVYDVVLIVDNKAVRLPAYSEQTARQFAAELHRLVDKYTLEPVSRAEHTQPL